jgi:hypothetical protein
MDLKGVKKPWFFQKQKADYGGYRLLNKLKTAPPACYSVRKYQIAPHIYIKRLFFYMCSASIDLTTTGFSNLHVFADK